MFAPAIGWAKWWGGSQLEAGRKQGEEVATQAKFVPGGFLSSLSFIWKSTGGGGGGVYTQYVCEVTIEKYLAFKKFNFLERQFYSSAASIRVRLLSKRGFYTRLYGAWFKNWNLLQHVLPWPKKRTILEIRGWKNAVRSCDIMLDDAQSAQGKVIRDCPRLLPCADRASSSMISHDGTAFFSPRISRMVLFFGQGSTILTNKLWLNSMQRRGWEVLSVGCQPDAFERKKSSS